MKKYTFNLVSEERFEEDEIEAMQEFMDDGHKDSKYAVVCYNMADDGEGHLTIEGTYPDDHFSEDLDELPETNFDAYDISIAINELCCDFNVTFDGTFTIIEGEVSITYDDSGKVVKEN